MIDTAAPANDTTPTTAPLAAAIADDVMALLAPALAEGRPLTAGESAELKELVVAKLRAASRPSAGH